MRIELFQNATAESSLVIKFRIPGGGHDDVYVSFMYTTSPGFKNNTSGKLVRLNSVDYGTSNYNNGGCVTDNFGTGPHLGGYGAHNYTFFYGMKDPCAGGTGFWWDGKGGTNTRSGPILNLAHGVWHHVEYRVKVNTPGESDGVLQAWHDGKLVLENTSMKWRKTGSHNVDRCQFEAFTSGDNEPAGPGHYLYYDNFVLAATRQSPPASHRGRRTNE
jgi:hypothetical protein